MTFEKKVTACRCLAFDAGHRVLGHEGKCRFPHGHRYVAEVMCEAELDHLGRIVDFAVIKDNVGAWIEKNWDHAFLVYEEDKELLRALATLKDKNVYVCSWNPTAENMATFLLVRAGELLEGTRVKVTSIRVYETPNCFAEAIQQCG